MSISFPTTLDIFSNPAGTSKLSSPDHASVHADVYDSIEAIETAIGTTTGTSVAKFLPVGKFAAPTVGGTLTTTTLVTPTIKNWDGWIDANETWTYASGTTITVPAGALLKYGKGDKIKLTQGTDVKFYYIVELTNTLLTISVGSSSGNELLLNAAITANYYSKMDNPQDFPQFILTGVTWGGFSDEPLASTGKFGVSGRLCHYAVKSDAAGTSNASTISVSLPITSAASYGQTEGACSYAINGGTILTTPAKYSVTTSATAATFYSDMGTSVAWATSDLKLVDFTMDYYI